MPQVPGHSIAEMVSWLDSLGLGEYAAAFTDNKIDAMILGQLSDDDLKALGVSALGDRKRLLAAIAELDRSAPVPTLPGPTAVPIAYTPRHLAERILGSRRAVEGERKHVTVLFADVKGSTALIDELDPEEAAGRLHPALTAMMDAVHRYEGMVNRVQGDGIMALFGAPLAHEDHAVRACLAALAIRDRFADGLEIRVGLHCGDVLVRAIHNDLSMDYDAIGQTAHIAGRMEQIAAAGSVLITESVRSLTEGYIETRSLGVVSVKGVKRKLEVHELVARTALRTRWEARAARALTDFVGRGRELETIFAAAESAAGGNGQLVALVGEAGMGKSRLVHEFTRAPQFDDWSVCHTGALSHGASTPYLPIGLLLRAIFAVEDLDDQAAIERKMIDGLTRIGTEVDSLIPVMQSLMDLPVSSSEWTDLDPQLRRIRIIDGVKQLVLRSTAKRPMVLVFEDLHWVDPESQRVLDALIDGMGARQLLLLVTYRPEYSQEWMQKSYYTRIRVDPLAATSTHQMLNNMLGSDDKLEPLKRLLIERTEGCPLFIEETVRSLRELDILAGQGSARVVDRDLTNIEIPASVQDVLAARIDRLRPELKNLLQTAAVIGRRVPVRLLRAIEPITEQDLSTRLTALQSSEFLYEAEAGDDPAYIFKHALTEEVAYASLMQETRQSLHGRLVDAIETAYAGRLEEHLEELSRHALRAEQWEKAFGYNREAAKKAHERSAYLAAIERFDNALLALDRLTDDAAHINDKMDIRLEMRTALWPLGRHEELAQRVREAGEIAERVGDIGRLANMHNYLTAHYWRGGEYRQAVEHGEKGIALAERAGDFSIRVTTMHHLGHAFNARGEFARQIELHRQVARDLTGPVAYQRHGMSGFPAAIVRGFLAWGLAEQGQFDEALIWAREGIEIASKVNSAMTTVWVTNYYARVHLLRGDFSPAIGLLEPNLELCQRAEVRLLLTLTCGMLGLAYCMAKRQAEAVQLLEMAARPENMRHHVQGSGFPLVWLADGYLQASRFTDARVTILQALDVARRQGEQGHQAWALLVEAEIQVAEGSPADVVASTFDAALELAERCGMRPLAARCRFSRGVARLGIAAAGGGRESIEEARKAFGELGMSSWLERADRILNKSG
ncbi:MAG TPA: adenylate/guanylate cyclase domain-containing protein [Gammaproteobacteria bacterium]|nr:adenylate/guanylate cyclase domain-containing protein [Gammaproteobacteria bacterium]